MHGPVSNSENNHEPTTENVKTVASQLMREVDKWVSTSYLCRQTSTSLVNPAAAVSALGELTPGGALMKGFREDSLSREYYFRDLKVFNLKNIHKISIFYF